MSDTRQNEIVDQQAHVDVEGSNSENQQTKQLDIHETKDDTQQETQDVDKVESQINNAQQTSNQKELGGIGGDLAASHVIVEGEKSLNQESSVEVVNDQSATLTNQKEHALSNESGKIDSENQADKNEQPSLENEASNEINLNASAHLDSVSSEKQNSSFGKKSVEPNVQVTEPVTEHVPSEEDLSTRITHANSLKESAKFYVKGENYNDAIKIYESAFYALKPTAKDRSHPEFRKCILLQIDLFNNLSFCYENIERYQEALAYAKRVLIFDDSNTKALFRIASILRKLGNNLEAFDQIKKCREAFKKQNPDSSLDPKIYELYKSLKDLCKDEIKKRESKEKELYSKMLGTSKDQIKDNSDSDSTPKSSKKKGKNPLSWKPIRYGLFLGPSIILGVVLARIIRQKSVETAKRHAPAIFTAIGALLVLTYVKNHVRKSVLGLGFAAAAALMVQRANKSGLWRTQG